MDISKIKASEVGTTYGIAIGNADAPVKIVEFLNMRCPFCKQWYDDSKDILTEYVAAGKVQRIIKHFDKEKPGLKKGNVVHHHLNYKDPDKALEEIDFFFAHQSEWGELESPEEVADYVKEKRGLEFQPNEIEINGIINEAAAANVTLVPTVFLGNEIFDEHITPRELTILIEAELKKANS